ncbi:tetratricopeptide repeat protein [Mucilaginibacter sp. Bleaf8]|uniref:tetratricopeptide repeat protein n=1 Tax=Mucilaginibacter sp. Bleaf8 TaxID=2834430 RepID=UPI001BCFFC32|nr:tetratricopeptide repeat protein [Mucilaginibacter sp. Bleaf8]MBS7563114.1 tetratricopeptide repeat protein [Mucilaginibacter sp. Bleaf8]
MLSRKILVFSFLLLFTAPLAFGQSEALKSVVNSLAFYRQKGELRYLSSAKKSVDSLIVTKSDSSNLEKNIYKAIVYSSIAFVDSTNQLNNPPDFVAKTTKLVDALGEKKKIYKYPTELDFCKRCLSNVYIRLGFISIRSMEFATAVDNFKKAQSYTPTFAPLNAYIAYANSKNGNLQEAVKYYNTLLTADSTRTEYVLATANIYKTMGDTAKALNVLQKGRRFLPTEKSLLLEEANIYSNRGDYRALEPMLVKLLDENQANADVAFVAANCYDHLKQYDRAESLYLRAIELNNSAYDPVLNLGLLYLKQSTVRNNHDDVQKNLERAALWLQKAYEMSPKNVIPLQLLQQVYAKTGNELQLQKINDKLQQLNN